MFGNTIGNIRNYGYLATDNKYLYYMSPNDAGTKMGINKIDKNNLSGESETLIDGTWEIVGINYFDNYLYFITMDDSDSEEDTVDNQIHKIKTDGTEHEIINDNDFNNDCYEIYVVNDKLYYIGTDECIYYMDLDGSNRTKLNDNASGYIGITEDYIFFNKIIENEDESDDTIDYVTYMMNIDGSNEHAIIEGEKLYDINLVGDYIYYITKNRYISKVKIDGTENTMLSDETAYNMIVTEEGIFYYNYYKVDGSNAGVALYKMDLDGENLTELTRLESSSESLCEFDDWLFFLDNNESEGRLELISKDGDQSIVLFRLDLTQYEEDVDEDETEDVDDSTTNIIDEAEE